MSIPAYTVEPSARCRTITLFVRPSGAISVRVPVSYDPSEVHCFVKENAGWIEKKRRIISLSARPVEHSVMIGDRTVPYTITYQDRRKNVAIRIHHDGRIEVRAPCDMTEDSIIAAVEKKRNWIRQAIDGDGEEEASSARDRDFVTWKGDVIPYTVRISSRARRIAIKVHIDRSVEVVAPARASRNDVRRVIEEKADWIFHQVTSSSRPVAVRRSFCDGETYPFLGGTLTVRVTRGKPKATSVREGPFIEVGLPDGITPAIERTTIREAVEYTLKDESRRAVLPRIARYAGLFGASVPPVEVRNNKRKWGCCIGRRKITFVTEVCMLTPRLLDYVVAHEVCHMVVMDHSDRFWETLQAVMPDCRERAAELRRDAPLYRLFVE